MAERRFALIGCMFVAFLMLVAIAATYWDNREHIARCEKWYADNPAEAERCVSRREPHGKGRE